MSKTPYLIALTGPAGSGKDTAGQLLADIAMRSGLDATCSAFADPIRAMLAGIIPAAYMSDRALKEQPAPGLGYSYRELAQTLGTDWGRVQMPGLWVKLREQALYGQPRAADAKPVVHIVTDLRFENEAAFVRRHGGIIICLHRAAATPVKDHESEWHWPTIRADVTIHNDFGLGDLRQALTFALARVVSGQHQREAA